MPELSQAFAQAFHLIVTADPGLTAIVLLSLRVSLGGVALAALFGLPLGAMLALLRFPGRSVLIVLLNATMGFPPVVAGLLIYLLLSRAGPLGSLGLLFTPTAMMLAQAFLVTPIVAALTRQVIEALWVEYADVLRSFRAGRSRAAATLLWGARMSLLTALLAGFGRAIAEVGAIIIVGGNIAGYTRTMTTAIALETSRGDLALALGLGLMLLSLSLIVNACAHGIGMALRTTP
jgi:tungstate transport system permease protein